MGETTFRRNADSQETWQQQREAERPALLLAVARRILEARVADGALAEQVFEMVQGHLDADALFSYCLDDDGTMLLVGAAGISDELRCAAQRLHLGDTLCERVAATREPLVADAAHIERDWAACMLREMGMRSYACHPLLGRDGKLLGTFALVSSRRDRFTPGEVDFLQTVSHFLALAWDRQRTEGDLRRRESEFRTLADHMSQFAWMTDADGSIFWYNRRWFDYTGTTLEEMRGWGWQKVHHPEHLDRVVRKLRGCFESGEPWEDTFPLRGRDGRYRWFLSRAVPVRDESGKVLRWFGTNTDVTEQRETEERLRQRERQRQAAEEALREANRRKDEFLATLAHELRNPLAPIRTGLQILSLSGNRAPAETRAMEAMTRQVTHMVRLIDDLLDVSRITRDRLELRRERLALCRVLDHAVEASRPLIDARRHELVLEVSDETLWLDADVTRLSQVVSNLLDNAAKYTPSGGRIDLSARREGHEAVIRVADTGSGIPPELRARVFDLFTQAGKSSDCLQGGLGIGLALAKRLVEMHQGTISVDSAGPGLGALFTVRLPLAAAAPSEAREGGGIGPRPGAAARRVLVIDDNRDAAESLAMVLELLGHEARAVHGGREALETIRGLQPSVVFCDIGMPGMDGYEVARRLREEPALAQIRLVALTGWGTASDKRRARDAGFDFHLTKPVDVSAVEELLAQLPQG